MSNVTYEWVALVTYRWFLCSIKCGAIILACCMGTADESVRWNTNVSCNIWMSHVICALVMCSIKCGAIIVACGVGTTAEWDVSHMNLSHYIGMSHVTYEWVTGHMSKSRHLHMDGSCVALRWFMCSIKCGAIIAAYCMGTADECDTSNTNASCNI